jgi:hypothetical protein
VIREVAAEFKPKKVRKQGRKKAAAEVIDAQSLLKLLDEAEAAATKNDIKGVKQVLAKCRKYVSRVQTAKPR